MKKIDQMNVPELLQIITSAHLPKNVDKMVKRLHFLMGWAVLLFVCVLPAKAQTPHSAQVAWPASPTVGASYKLYRAPCNGTISNGVCSVEGTFVVIGNTTLLTLTDATVSAGFSYAYYVTAFCSAGSCPGSADGESAASNHIAGTIPKDAGPSSPGNPTLVVK